MTLKSLLRIIGRRLRPTTWLDAWGLIISMLVTLIAIAAITQLLKGALP